MSTLIFWIVNAPVYAVAYVLGGWIAVLVYGFIHFAWVFFRWQEAEHKKTREAIYAAAHPDLYDD